VKTRASKIQTFDETGIKENFDRSLRLIFTYDFTIGLFLKNVTFILKLFSDTPEILEITLGKIMPNPGHVLVFGRSSSKRVEFTRAAIASPPLTMTGNEPFF
jgi:hypothetical protein